MRPSRSTGCNNADASGGVGDEPSGTAGVLAAPPVTRRSQTPSVCDTIDSRWHVEHCLSFRAGHMRQVERPRSRPDGASWGPLGIDKPRGLRSLLGRAAADSGQVPRFHVGTCAGTRSPPAGRNWFTSGSFSRSTGSKCRIRANWARLRATYTTTAMSCTWYELAPAA